MILLLKTKLTIAGRNFICVANYTPTQRKNLVEAVKAFLGDDSALEEEFGVILSSKAPVTNMAKWIRRNDDLIREHANNMKITSLKQLADSDYRKGYYEDEYTYSVTEYRDLLYLKVRYTLFMLSLEVTEPNNHHNCITNIIEKYLPIPKVPYNKMATYIKVHAKLKPSEWMETGELMNVVPLEERVLKALIVSALARICHNQEGSTISALYNILGNSRKFEFNTTRISRAEEAGWVSTFRQTSRLTIGEEGEVEENCAILSELCSLFKLTEVEIEHANEFVKMSELMREGDCFEMPSYMTSIVTSFTNTFLPNAMSYLHADSMINVVSVIYAMATTISMDLAYIMCTTPEPLMDNPFKTNHKTHQAIMGNNVSKATITKLESHFLVLDRQDVNKLLVLSNDYRISMKTGNEVVAFVSMKDDAAKLLLRILETSRANIIEFS